MLIITTYKCNFSCNHCCYSCNPNRNEHITMNIFKKIFENNKDKTLRICGGEMFLHKDWKKHLLYLNDKIDKLEIITNASLFYNNDSKKTNLFKSFINILYKLSNIKSISIIISYDKFHIEQFNINNKLPLDKVIDLI